MSLKDGLSSEVRQVFSSIWTDRDGTVVPDDSSVKLTNDAVKLDATVFYADLADSTALVDSMTREFAAEVYKTFLLCAGKIIRGEGGVITAYDGDRVMAVFIGDGKNSSAVRVALKLNWARQNIIQPALKVVYPRTDYVVRHVVGIDTSPLFVAKTGVRGANDLVWVGRAANHAAKMAALSHAYPTYISSDVYSVLNEEAKYSSGKDMWEAVKWTGFDNRTIYRSSYWWSFT